jgi:(p)ppGpp synthase/HD superfamily hydrolase
MNTQTMIEIMMEAHAGQVDKAGAPYHLHPLSVAHRLVHEHRMSDEELECIALGHDLFEDTYVDADYLRARGASERIIAGIQAMTKVPGQTKKQYQETVLANIDASYAKRADLEENMDLSRLPEVTERDLRRNENYARFHAKVTARIEEFESSLKAPLP